MQLQNKFNKDEVIDIGENVEVTYAGYMVNVLNSRNRATQVVYSKTMWQEINPVVEDTKQEINTVVEDTKRKKKDVVKE